jgi:diguanylate cyclase (GGDEF)-like protein/PAS domain S-box-containing protein
MTAVRLPADDQSAPRPSPAAGSTCADGRFELVSLLKQGNGIATFNGVDRNSRAPVVVKSVEVGEVPTAVRMRLEHEAHVLESLPIGATSRVLWSGQEGSYFLLVQPRLAGQTLSELLEQGSLSVASTLRIATGVLTTLQLAHEKGVLHRDIKPANIIVEGGASVDNAELIDFGLARSGDLDDSLRDEPVGTVRYVAPEAAGLINVSVDQRSDLYSLGVVLFECLAGHPPFGGDTVGELLRQHLNTRAPQLRSLGLAVPRALDGLIQRLLSKVPEARYQSSMSLLSDVEELVTALAAGVDDPMMTLGLHDRRHILTEPTFVGRTQELHTLSALLDRVTTTNGGLVLLEAESGAGKTRLLDELALQAGRRDIWVLRGQGVDQVAQRPFQVLDGVVSAIVTAESDTPPEERLLSRLGDWAEAAEAALPALRGTSTPVDQSALGPEAYGETRSINALAALLNLLGQGARPALVLLDDCQWADALTLKLLAKWQSDRDRESSRHVLVVVAFRSDEVPPGHPIRSLDPLATVSLTPFSPADIEALCWSMAGKLPEEALATVVRLADGSPFMGAAVLRGMVETGALRDTAEGWELDPGPMQDVQTSRRAALFLSRRFELVVPEAMRLLTVGAILGKEFDLGLAVSLSHQIASQVTIALDDARRRRFLWVDEINSVCSFTHDKLRETVLERLSVDDRKALHMQAAELIEASDSDRAFELAYHFDAGGESVRALPYAIRAAEIARGQHALDVAVTHYRIAERATRQPQAESDRTLAAGIAEGLGDVLTLQGDYTEATTHLARALSFTTDAVGRAVIDGKLGNIAFKKGDQARARQYLEGALRDLGRWVPQSGVAKVVAALGQVLVQSLHTVAPRLFLRRRSLAGAERQFVAIRIYSRLAYVYWFSAGKVPCAWAHLREMNLAELYPPTPELAQAYSEHAPVMTMLPWFSRGLTYARRSLEIRQESGDVWGQGQSFNFLGVVLYASTRYRECIEACRESVRLLTRTGDRWEQNTATWHQIFSHYRLGELDTAFEMARELYYTATAIGDVTAAGIALSGWARAGVGRVPEAFVAIELGRDLGDAQTSTEVHLADGLRLLYAGELERAAARLEEAKAIVAAAGLRQEYVAPVLPWLATARRSQVEAADPHDPGTRRRLLRNAARAARRADRLARSYRNNRPHALRERALVASLRGHRAKARRLFAESVTIAEKQGAAYETILTQAAAARLSIPLGEDRMADELSVSEADLRSLEPRQPQSARATLSLADRFETLLAVGRRIGSAASPSAVYREVHEAAAQLLRGDYCVVIPLVKGPDLSGVSDSGEIAPKVSRSLLARAIEQRSPVVSGAMEQPDSSDSMLLAELRSALCAPIISEGQVVACFFVMHHQVNDLFGDVEVQVAEFIATLAGAALEHVAGSEAHFRSLAQNSSDVITIVDRNGTITYQSSSVEQVFGHGPDEMVGLPLASWLHPEDAAALLVFLESPRDGESAATLVQTRMRHRDGTWRVGESAVRSLFDDPGVEGLLLNTRDASERVALEQELRTRATHDPLTGLANRSLFVERVNNAIGRRKLQKRPLSVVFLDLDDFKSINDSRGHAVGDTLLEMTGVRLEQCVRPGDTVARWGGDEFAVLLENADGPSAEAIVRRIIRELELPYKIGHQEVLSRASVGIAVTRGEESSADLLVGADLAMYVAKSRGGSHFEFFEADMREAAIERSALRTDLEWALQRSEMVVHYQPIVDLPGGELTGFEALLRWNHPDRGELSPNQWIALAEESGMIVPIGSWVLRQACQQVAEWRRTHACELTIAVNVSARQLQSSTLVDEIAGALDVSGLDAGSLVLEITESATVVDTEGVITRLDALKGLGVGLSIDDFGTGYSSLSHLRRFPVDHLKVDQTFVAEVAANPEDRAIVSSVIDLGHSLGVRVVAEGVENDEQFAVLCEMACDQAQGFKWRRPATAQEVTDWLVSLDSEKVAV